MPLRRSPRIVSLAATLAAVAALAVAAPAARASVLDKTAAVSGFTVHYKVVLPNNYDPAKDYPAVLAFPGGPQTMDTVEGTLERHWRAEAERRGYIVVIPASPNGHLYFEAGDRIFPAFFTKLLADYKITGNKFHIAGISNGGLSAFHIAATYPQYFWSVTGFPGFLPDSTTERDRAIAGLCVDMHVGELDIEWLTAMQQQVDEFHAKGMKVRFTVEKGQSHRLETFEGPGAARLFDQFEDARNGCKQTTK